MDVKSMMRFFDYDFLFFQGFPISRDIFPKVKFSHSQLVGGRLNVFHISVFSEGSSKIQFQRIYESNNQFFQGVLVFKNLVVLVHTPVWIKNGVACCVLLLSIAIIVLGYWVSLVVPLPLALLYWVMFRKIHQMDGMDGG